MTMIKVSLADQIAEVRREIEMRKRTYVKMIDQGRMSPWDAELRTTTMYAVLATLEAVREAEIKKGAVACATAPVPS